MAKNLDIDTCIICKHIDYAAGQKGDYLLCSKEERIIQIGNRMQFSNTIMKKVDIPEWCPLADCIEPELLKKE